MTGLLDGDSLGKPPVECPKCHNLIDDNRMECEHCRDDDFAKRDVENGNETPSLFDEYF